MDGSILALSNELKNCSINSDFYQNNFKNISSKKDLLMQSLINFFTNREYLDQVIPIITGKSKISLRILDWFVTNYSKKNNTHFQVDDVNSKVKNFIVYLDYKAQLKAYSKKSFDPFCRRERISFIDHDNKELITTVGQLNFFRWGIENNILSYINENFEPNVTISCIFGPICLKWNVFIYNQKDNP